MDHFIPWARYPDDGIENLVLADAGCNGAGCRTRLRRPAKPKRWLSTGLKSAHLDGCRHVEAAITERRNDFRRDVLVGKQGRFEHLHAEIGRSQLRSLRSRLAANMNEAERPSAVN